MHGVEALLENGLDFALASEVLPDLEQNHVRVAIQLHFLPARSCNYIKNHVLTLRCTRKIQCTSTIFSLDAGVRDHSASSCAEKIDRSVPRYQEFKCFIQVSS